ncbi:hypothetical protein H257_15948 [Aphanomyces astaci]|uniref:Uncharacterized protein n=1 Tax=Aphanomyces astaci TaxID=112090 RepID=W4FMC8_APHAT|nr:hypothetical protein H257_15948 [Aphanomyces astaci]ETV67984.1 hypothetical protein H257_15948 [Aphanomyces astaci]|eukprot:XP_009842547.1 hypothetical protein H257_15948 [Aphanomyces astaci]
MYAATAKTTAPAAETDADAVTVGAAVVVVLEVAFAPGDLVVVLEVTLASGDLVVVMEVTLAGLVVTMGFTEALVVVGAGVEAALISPTWLFLARNSLNVQFNLSVSYTGESPTMYVQGGDTPLMADAIASYHLEQSALARSLAWSDDEVVDVNTGVMSVPPITLAQALATGLVKCGTTALAMERVH